jgi:hypothetical protein
VHFFVFAGTLDAWSRKKPAPGCWWKLDKTTDAVTREKVADLQTRRKIVKQKQDGQIQ